MTQWNVRRVDTKREWNTHSEQNELYHYGVKGMKWGVRRTQEELGHKTSASASISVGSKNITVSIGGGGSGVKKDDKTSDSLSTLASEMVKLFPEESITDEELSELINIAEQYLDNVENREEVLEYVDNINDLLESVDNKDELMKEVGKRVVQKGKDAFKDALKKIGDTIKSTARKVKDAVVGFVNAGKEWISNLFKRK